VHPESDWHRSDAGLMTALRERRAARPLPSICGYDVLAEIRRGGQGVVFLGRQRSTRRLVAIKVLGERAGAHDAARRRFEREVELTTRLRHPNIVSVFDSGQTADQRPFLAMEFVDGRPLDHWLSARQERPQDKSEVRATLRTFAGICAAVCHAHQRGVIHRDLKPGNVLIDEDGLPRVLDFGIGRRMPLAASDSGAATTDSAAGALTTDGFLGTLAYAAPEQLHEAGSADTRSDVYALGLILYEMLTGRLPHVPGAPVAELAPSIGERTPLAPSAALRRAGLFRRAPLDRDVDTIVLKALAKQPERRYQTVDALAADVERYLDARPIEARRDNALYVAGALLRRHKLASALGAALLLALVAFAATMTALFQRTRLEADRSRQVRLFLEDTLASVDPATPGGEITLGETLDEALHWVELIPFEHPEVEAALRQTLARSYLALGRLNEAERQAQRVLSIYRSAASDHDAEYARAMATLGLVARQRGDLVPAELSQRNALTMLQAALGDDHPEVGYALHSLADTLALAGRLDEAEALLQEARAIHRAVHGPRHPDTAMSEYRLAETCAALGRLAEAERLHRAALTTREAALPAAHPDIERSLLALGRLLTRAGRPHEAQPLLERCLELRQGRLPPGHWRIEEAAQALREAR